MVRFQFTLFFWEILGDSKSSLFIIICFYLNVSFFTLHHFNVFCFAFGFFLWEILSNSQSCFFIVISLNFNIFSFTLNHFYTISCFINLIFWEILYNCQSGFFTIISLNIDISSLWLPLHQIHTWCFFGQSLLKILYNSKSCLFFSIFLKPISIRVSSNEFNISLRTLSHFQHWHMVWSLSHYHTCLR